MSAWANFMRGIQREHAWVHKKEEEEKRRQREEAARAIAEAEKKQREEMLAIKKWQEKRNAQYNKLVNWVHEINKQVVAEKKKLAEKKKERLKLLEDAEKNYSGWKPRIWSGNGKSFTVISGLEGAKNFDTNFDIFVTSEKHFDSGFLKFPIEYKPKDGDKFVRRAKFDLDDAYFASIAAGYVLGNKCGFSRKHMADDQPKIISCIAKYFLYFHMQRFLQSPDLLKPLLTYDEQVMIQRLIPVTKVWKRKFYDSKEIPILWWNEQKKKGREIKDVQAEHYADGNGQLGIVYHECVGENPVDVSNDFMQYIPEKSLGLTSLGTKYFQQAIESFVYSVLGAQARTRWDIVDGGARSLQTQDVFRKLVRDTILERDTTKAISNMRQAIKDTNVVLNMAVSPGLILVPSDMIIVKEKTPGWNNILTLATDKMLFGTNKQVNEKKTTKTAPDPKKPEQKMGDKKTEPETHSRVKRSAAPSQQSGSTKTDASQYIILGVATSLIVKMIMMLV